MKKSVDRYLKIFRAVWGFSKKYVFITVFIKIFTLVNVYVMLYFNKQVLNALSLAIVSETANIPKVILLLVICSLVEVLFTLLFNILQYNLGKLKLRYDDELAIKLALNFSNLDMSYYDDPRSYNQTKQIGKCKTAILDGYNGFLNISFSFLSFIIAIVVTVKFSILVTVLSIISLIPGFILRRKFKVKHYNVEKEILTTQRFTDYLLSLFYNKNIEMEMQTYGFKNHIINKVVDGQKVTRDVRIKNSLENAKNELSLLVLSKFFYIVQQIIVVVTIVKRNLTIGDFSYYGGVIKNLSSSLESIIASINDIHMNGIKYDEFLEIISRQPKIFTDGNLAIGKEDVKTIEFRHVSFRYPNTSLNVLNDVSFSFNIGDKIALVGENGAGKTSLIKLLLRFYDPSEGEILLNGVNIKEYNLSEYRKLFSSMFQETTLYLLSIKENIAISDIDLDDEDINQKINLILKDLNLEVINGKAIDINAAYGREFDANGYVFSKGQQQRLHAARTLFHQGSIFILDEPAASMDAIAESQFLATLVNHTAEKSVLYITHRYNNLHTMNNIIVLQKGCLVESGTHYELINRHGVYYEMFELQKNNNH